MTEVKRKIEQLDIPRVETLRPISEGAEEWLGKVIPVLDHGFVRLVDYMGNDKSIDQAARVSYGRGTRKVSATEGLIRYLRRHRHTTPFEMVDFKFHAKMPIVVARQWVRHRTASINEYSARYSVLSEEFYIPEPQNLALQSSTNRQGGGEAVDPEYAEEVRERFTEYFREGYTLYDWLLNEESSAQHDPERPGLARETARNAVPPAVYTEWYWKSNLHNVFHFLKLRMDPHAQFEVRQYANAMSQVVADSVPMAWRAFEDYELEATYLSRQEREIMIGLLGDTGVIYSSEDVLTKADEIGLTNKRERGEILAKFVGLGIIKEE